MYLQLPFFEQYLRTRVICCLQCLFVMDTLQTLNEARKCIRYITRRGFLQWNKKSEKIILYTNLLSCRMIILCEPFLQSWYFRFRIKTDSHSWFGHLKLFRRWWSRHQIGWNSQGPIATEVMRRICSSRRWELKRSGFWKAFDLIFQSSDTKNWRTFKIEKLFTVLYSKWPLL